MSKWFKIGSVLVAGALLITGLAGVALAQGAPVDADGVRDPVGDGVGPAWGFVDKDGDGVNDRYLSAPEFVDEDGDGICDLCGAEMPAGVPYGPGYRYLADPAFVDQDGDGVCDNYGQYSQSRGMGRGRWGAGR